MNTVTQLLNSIGNGEPRAAEELLPLVYEELRRLAAFKMSGESAGQTLQPTALVHEAWLRVAKTDGQSWQNRGHFFSAAAAAMRRILVDNARRKKAARHGGGREHLELSELDIAGTMPDDELLALDEALKKFAAADPRKAELVSLRYFTGLAFADAARVLDISEPTAKRWWAYARAWLLAEMKKNR